MLHSFSDCHDSSASGYDYKRDVCQGWKHIHYYTKNKSEEITADSNRNQKKGKENYEEKSFLRDFHPVFSTLSSGLFNFSLSLTSSGVIVIRVVYTVLFVDAVVVVLFHFLRAFESSSGLLSILCLDVWFKMRVKELPEGRKRVAAGRWLFEQELGVSGKDKHSFERIQETDIEKGRK